MRRILIPFIGSLSICFPCLPASAANLPSGASLVPGVALLEGANWMQSFISEITYVGNTVMVRLAAGVTNNCAGSPGGWMRVPETSKPMQAYLTGLWLSGSASQTSVVVYTDGDPSSSNFCTISQIQPLQ